MGNYQLPPDIGDSFNTLSQRVAGLERGVPLARASVSRAGVTTIANTGGVVMPFDTVVFDSSHMWNVALPSRLTVPPGLPSAVFMVCGQMFFTAGATAGAAQIYVWKNRTGTFPPPPIVTLRFAATESSWVNVVGVLPLNPNDYIELAVDQNSASNCSAVNVALSVTIQG